MAENLFGKMNTPEGAALANVVSSLYSPESAAKRAERDAMIEKRRMDAELNRAKIEKYRMEKESKEAASRSRAEAMSNLVRSVMGGTPQGDAVMGYRAAGGVQSPEVAGRPVNDDEGFAMPLEPMPRPEGYTPQKESEINRLATGFYGEQGLGGKSFKSAMEGAGAAQNQNIIADVLAALQTPQAASAAVAAGKGTPFFSESGGRVLDKFGGALNESGPQAVANVAKTGAQAAAQQATADLRAKQAGIILPNQTIEGPGGSTFPVAGGDISKNITAAMFGPKAGGPQTKAPAGYRPTASGDLEPIPGGPADLKIQGAYNADTASLQSTTAAMDRLGASANELLNHPGLKGITGIRGAIPNIPGTDAANAEALLTSLKAKVGFNTLQEMRNASRTGGALGSVSDREHVLLQSYLAALDKAQNIQQFQQSLAQIREFAQSSKGRLQEAYNMRHSARSSAPTAPSSPAPTVSNW